MRDWLAIYLKGCCMGAADMIPGVSGGTIALIVGIYDRLVDAIAAIDPRIIGHLRDVADSSAREAFLADLERMDIPFLLVLAAGIGTAVVVLSRVVLGTLQAYPAEVNAFFFGLIGASALLIYRDVTIDSPGRVGVVLAGFLLAFLLSGQAAAAEGTGNPVIVFLTGAVAISAMVLPGISGAAILYILGQFEFMLAALRTFIDGLVGLVTGAVTPDSADATLIVGIFLVGAVIGLVTTARIVSWALEHYRVATLAFLVSLMVGALRLPITEIHAATGIPGPLQGVGIAAAAVIGIVAVLGLDHATGSLDYV